MSSPSAPPLDTELAERALVRFLRDEAARVGFGKLVLGVSGGLDSAVASLLAARAVGPANVVAVAMPSARSSAESLEHARLIAAAGGFALEVVSIGPAEDALASAFGEMTPLRRGNVLARLRMVVLYERSAAAPALVVGTSNKTELLLGYGTIFGDMSSAINPLGDLYKTQVRTLGRHLGVPEAVLAKTPSPDLWPGQTSEGELGFSYAQADAILWRLVDVRASVDEVVAEGFDDALVRRIHRTMMRAQFKRRPPMIAKLSTRTIGWEFRYPRDWGT